MCGEEVYVIEVNPRSSRTVPYISKVTGIPIVPLATKVIIGHKIKELGCKAGIALNPSVPLETIEYYLPLLDKVTIMIVDAGISGQKVIEQTYDKIRKLVKIREEKGLDFLIEADGSMNRDVYLPLYEAGADMVVLGPPALWNKADDFEEAWAIMENELESELN